jgi:ankyrin repeat protein
MPNRVGSNGATIIPGNSAGSRLYQRVSGNKSGLQMPPTGALSPEEISTIKNWIDQGAEWPDDLSGDVPPSPADARATRMMAALRDGDRPAFEQLLKENPAAVNLRGPGGSTPLIYAALYGDADSLRLLLDRGADPNLRNDAHATALMYAVDNLEKTRLLLEHRADPNARSEEGRTPLMIAASGIGSNAVIKVLIEHGADPSTAPLNLAVPNFDDAILEMLMRRGADLRPYPLSAALRAECSPCVERLIKAASPGSLNTSLAAAARFGDVEAVKRLLAQGADPGSVDGRGFTPLMIAAASEAASADIIKGLLDGGVNVNAKNFSGETALDLAKRQGQTSVVDLLIKVGAKEGDLLRWPIVKPKPASSARAAVERSIPLLQRADAAFFRKSGCVSCHNNSLTAMTVATARNNGLPVNEEIAQKQLQTIGSYLESWRERVLEGDPIPGRHDTISYILLGLAAENYPPDAATDAMARYLKSRETAEGRWAISSSRPPQEASDIEVTAVSLRALQVYAPTSQRAEYERAIQLAAMWLAKAQPKTNEDRAFQLLGLQWAHAEKEIISRFARELVSEQRSNGGWAQLPSLPCDAYATGQALVALRETGAIAVSDATYLRGIRFLLNSQLEDGSWHVRTRAVPVQPYFDSDFPHARDQFISAAATNWATMALAVIGTRAGSGY